MRRQELTQEVPGQCSPGDDEDDEDDDKEERETPAAAGPPGGRSQCLERSSHLFPGDISRL